MKRHDIQKIDKAKSSTCMTSQEGPIKNRFEDCDLEWLVSEKVSLNNIFP